MLRRGSSNVNSAGDGSEPRSWMSRRGSGASPSSGEGQPGGGGGFGLRRRTSTLATQNVFVKAGKGASNKISPVTPVVFFFDIVFETVENLNTLGSAVVIFERGSTLESSEPFKVKDGRADIAFSIAKEMTLYKANADSEQLKEKVYKVAIRSGHKNGKTLGKFRVDLSEYADPLGNERKLKLKMSNGSALVLRIRSKFVHSGKRAKNPDSDSMSQSSAGTYMSSSDIGSDEAYASLDDLDDLDELESDIEFTSASQSHTQ
uniref:C2 NT-type domain-containing protein n=2 Tax=Rhodosorus marinus TaxID=101924 RepID=A0A7S3A7M7_9RHOD|mmetsp:Transcript_631/g.1403  ORF Transcript_631/g.1403 Transcript_631/m.1403 type:complete len:261 (+) Transcript_631:837-1619(+)